MYFVAVAFSLIKLSAKSLSYAFGTNKGLVRGKHRPFFPGGHEFTHQSHNFNCILLLGFNSPCVMGPHQMGVLDLVYLNPTVSPELNNMSGFKTCMLTRPISFFHDVSNTLSSFPVVC